MIGHRLEVQVQLSYCDSVTVTGGRLRLSSSSNLNPPPLGLGSAKFECPPGQPEPECAAAAALPPSHGRNGPRWPRVRLQRDLKFTASGASGLRQSHGPGRAGPGPGSLAPCRGSLTGRQALALSLSTGRSLIVAVHRLRARG